MIVWTCLLTLAGCGKKDMDYTMQNESSVAESVRETGEESVLIQNEDAGEGENAAPETKYITIDLSGGRCSFTVNVKNCVGRGKWNRFCERMV